MINVDEFFEKRYGGKSARQYFEENEYFTPIEMVNFAKHCIEQLNKPVVSGKRPDHKTIRAAARKYSKDIWGQKDIHYKNSIEDFTAGAQWTLSQVACATAKGATVGNSAAGQSGRVGCVHNTLKYIGPWYSCEDCGTHFNALAEAPPEGALPF